MIALLAAIALGYHVVAVGGERGAMSSAAAINNAGMVAGQMGGAAATWDGTHLVSYAPVAVTPMDGPYSSTATGINDLGVAVGHDGNYNPVVMSGLEVATAAIFRDGHVTFIDESQFSSFEAQGINNAGEIVGGQSYRGFVRGANGAMVTIQPLSSLPQGNGTWAYAIDQEGHIVGGTTVPGPQAGGSLRVHAFLLTLAGGAQRMRDLGALPGFPDTIASAINEGLTIVGSSGNAARGLWTGISGPSHAWVWQLGTMHDLGTLSPGDSSYANGINDANVIVGCSGNRAVRWVNKQIEDLNALIDPGSGWILTCANAINRAGWIVGNGTYDGVQRAFLLVPK